MPRMVIPPSASKIPCLELAYESSSMFRVWTPSKEWSPLEPNPSRKDPRDKSVNLLETVSNVVKRPSVTYEIEVVEAVTASPITLYERMTLELGHFRMTGQHWSPDYWSICSGSRCYKSPTGSYIPIVRWFRNTLVIHFTQEKQSLQNGKVVRVAW